MQSIREVVYIRATADAVWSALTNPDLTERYWGGMRIESDWRPGSKIRYHRSGQVTDEHAILGIERLRYVVHTFRPLVPEFMDESPSRVVLRIAAQGPVVRLSVRHEGFPPHSKVYLACRPGWPIILNGLKTLLESGVHMRDAGALA